MLTNYQVNLKGLTFTNTHGVHLEEKLTPQPFVVDISVSLRPEKVLNLDDSIENGLSYSEYAKVAQRVTEGEHCDLIETLATRILDEVLALSSDITAVKVAVHKPQAPLSVDFDDVSVIIEGSK